MAHSMVLHGAMQASRADELRAAGVTAGVGFAEGAQRIQELHGAIARRAFGERRSGPSRVIHDAISAAVYAAVRTAGAGAARAGGAAMGALSPPGADPLSSHPAIAAGLGALSGAFGDALERDANPLAVPMAVRAGGRDVPCEPEALAAAFPAAGPRLALFTHGLCETEASWRMFAGESGEWYGSRLRADLGLTPVCLRYNSGLHISENGRRLSALLEELVAAWPVEVREIVLIGHSMGGLVNRSACHYGAEASWTGLVRHVFTLGAPHLGAPLERAANRAAAAMSGLPETQPLATALRQRSAGIKDLRHGSLVDDDWEGRDPDDVCDDPCTDVPLLESAAHYVIGATLSREPDAPLGRLIGDLLVLYPSSCGESRHGRRIEFEIDNRRHFGGVNHFRLLNHPDVYATIREWLDRSALGTGDG